MEIKIQVNQGNLNGKQKAINNNILIQNELNIIQEQPTQKNADIEK